MWLSVILTRMGAGVSKTFKIYGKCVRCVRQEDFLKWLSPYDVIQEGEEVLHCSGWPCGVHAEERLALRILRRRPGPRHRRPTQTLWRTSRHFKKDRFKEIRGHCKGIVFGRDVLSFYLIFVVCVAAVENGMRLTGLAIEPRQWSEWNPRIMMHKELLWI